jgi:peptide/nickel transport system substrate-binding protein
MKKLFLGLAIFAMAAFAFADPYVWDTASDLAEPGLAASGGSVTLAVLSGSRTWNNMMSREVDTARDLAIGYVTPVRRNNQTLQYEPYAAESVEVSEDGLTYTVTFRPDLQWSDGTPMTARDFFLYYTLATDPEVESENADNFFVGNDPIIVDLVDDLTLVFTFPSVSRNSLSNIAFTNPIPDHVLGELYRNEGAEAFKAAWGTDADVADLVYDGPFMIQSYSPDERYVLVRNPGFAAWNVDSSGTSLPYLDEAVYVVAPQEAQLNLFVAGDLDVYSPANLDEVGVVNNAITNEGLDATLRPNLYPTTSTTFFSFNWNRASDPFKQELFRNVFFRRAMSHLTPREALVDLVLGGAGEPAFSPVTTALVQWSLPTDQQVRYTFDPEAALELLAQIGFTEKNADGFLVDAAGNELGFKLTTNAGNANREQSIQVIADTMREFGVNVETEALDFSLLVDQLLATGDDRPFDAILIGLTAGGQALDWPFSESVQTCTGTLHMWNQSGACLNARETLIGELQKQGIQTLDDAAAEAINLQLQTEFASMQSMVYTYVPLLHGAWTNDVGGQYNDATLNSFNTTRSMVTTFRK